MLSHNAQTHTLVLEKLREFKIKEYESKTRDLQDKLNKLDMKEKILRQNRHLKM